MKINPVTYVSFFGNDASTINRQRFETFSEALQWYADREHSASGAGNPMMCYYFEAQMSVADGGLPGFFRKESPSGVYHFEVEWRAQEAALEEYYEGNRDEPTL